MKKVLILAVTVLFGSFLKAQQNPTIDNYLFNPISIAPSLAGQQNGMIQTIYDAQWIGLKGAPRTGAAYYDYLSPSRFGFNLGIVDDQVGPMTNQNLALTTSYHLQVAKETYLAVGIRYSLSHTSVDLNDAFYVDKLDNEIYNIDGPWFQNVDLSATLYNQNWYVGTTVKNMVTQEMYSHNYTARVAHIYGGYHFEANSQWTITPSLLVNATNNAPLDINLHVYGEFEEKWGIGANLSPADELGIFTLIKLPAHVSLFYQYNYPLSELVYVTRQSHVIGVGFDLIHDAKTIVSPRYFL
jgi:type IX secretion system PorP/SprF family membrane protein